MDRWNVTEEIRNTFMPILRQYVTKLEQLTENEINTMSNKDLGMELSGAGISPSQLKGLLEELGYEERERDDNGWELDFWITMERKDYTTFESGCHRMVIRGCGMTFELKLFIDGLDF